MSRTEPVLISISVVVDAPKSEPLPKDAVLDSVQEAFLDDVASRLEPYVDSIRSEPWFLADVGASFNYLEEEENATRCSGCGRWTSDPAKEGYLHALMIGRSVDGSILCDECEHFGHWFTADAE